MPTRLARIAGVFFFSLTLLGAGCQKEEAPKPDPNKLVWRQLAVALSDNSIAHLAVLRVDDTVKDSPATERQVQQALLAELTQIPELEVVEADQDVVKQVLAKRDTDPATGIAADTAKDLCTALRVEAFIYASVENETFDTNIKIYLGEPGKIVFSKTLQDLAVPAADEKPKKSSAPATEAGTDATENKVAMTEPAVEPAA
ncbi:MAG: hypothetical protein ABI743_10770 [bacterium]